MKVMKLDKLEKAATPGPWKWDCGNNEIESRHKTHFRTPICIPSDMHDRKTSMGCYWEGEDYCPIDYADDMELIVGMRNNFIKMLAVVKAASEMRVFIDKKESCDASDLLAALDAFEESEKSV